MAISSSTLFHFYRAIEIKKFQLLLFVFFICCESFAAKDVKINGIKYGLDNETMCASVSGDKMQYSGDIVIPDSIIVKNKVYKVTRINTWAFSKSYITSITFGKNVAQIDWESFNDCSQLKEVTIGDNVTTIGNRAFSGCSQLKEITIGDNVTTIGRSAFSDCSQLQEVTIGKNVSKIYMFEKYNDVYGFYPLFSKCENLKKVYWNSSSAKNITSEITVNYGNHDIWRDHGTIWPCVEVYNNDYFYYPTIEEVCFGENVDTIPEYFFLRCNKLKKISYSKSIKGIGKGAFQGCNLTSIDIPETVVEIKDDAFQGTKIHDFILPFSVKKVGNNVFPEAAKKIILPPAIETCGTLNNDCDIYYPDGMSINAGSKAVLHPLPKEQLLCLYPFKDYLRYIVETDINKWQKKGEFETTSDWRQRVTTETRTKRIEQVSTDAAEKYIAYWADNNKNVLELGEYDADNETYIIRGGDLGTSFLKVPMTEASSFKQIWDSCKYNLKYMIADGNIAIQSITVTTPNSKVYTYSNTDAIAYNTTSADFHFDSIDLDLASNLSNQQIGQKTVSIGKSDVDMDIPENHADNEKTFVIIIANEDYQQVASVPYAINDGEIFSQYCEKTLGIPSKNIHMRKNATLNNMRYELNWLSQICKVFDGEARVILYYAGHGIPDESNGASYLLPVDGDGAIAQSGYKLSDLYENLSNLNAKNILVFMDACFSGSKRGEGMLASARGVAIKAKTETPQGNMVVFSATQGDETAYPYTDKNHGMFTYYLLKKLQESKGTCTLEELGDYIKTKVSQQSILENGKTQTPTIISTTSLASDWKKWMLR